MSIAIGIIGAGVMGADHARTLATRVAGAHLALVADADIDRARAVVAEIPGARAVDDPLALIADPFVEAVLIASPDATHAEYTLACLAAGKPVLCEKPLAPTSAECLSVLAAEVAIGRRLVQVGYMRRFDPAYVEMKTVLTSGSLGRPFLFHCTHRNASVPGFFTSGMAISNSCVHEIDIMRWLLSTELESVRVLRPRSSVAGKGEDPLMVIFETRNGELVDVELFLNAGYGYEVRGELVCEKGTLSLAPPVLTDLRANGVASHSFAADWRPRFADAYRLQMQAWIGSLKSGIPVGSSAWDGYVASAVAEAGLASLASGERVAIDLAPMPGLYVAIG